MENPKSWYQNSEMLIGISALLVSVIALAVGVYSAYTDREYARASVWPSIEVHRTIGSNERPFGYTVRNNGIGPAIVKQMSVSVGDVYFKNWVSLFHHLGIEVTSHSQSHIGTSIVASQQVMYPYVIRDKDLDFKLLAEKDRQVSIEICYCSIYQQCWLVDRSNTPQSVTQCAIPDNRLFAQ